jgi:hypothetical protein
MGKRFIIYFLFGTIFVSIFCAKKMLPPSPDRFAPHLSEIDAVNRVRIDLNFDEEINVSKLTPQSLFITSSAGETLRIRTISRGKTSNTVSLFTEKIKPEEYYLSGTVEDKAGNIRRVVNKRFKGSSIIDTIPPTILSIIPKIGAIKLYKRIYFDFGFSEPMDTLSNINYLVYPLDKNKIKSEWSSDWQDLTFSYPDSLLPHTAVYFILQPTLKDLENNWIANCGYTFFYTDSVIPSVLASGNLYYHDKAYKNGIIIFANDTTKRITVSDISGKFSIRLDSTLYNITAIADTNYDNTVDLFTEQKNFNPKDTTTIKLNLTPILESKTIDSYLR